jgi:hypothetical protein
MHTQNRLNNISEEETNTLDYWLDGTAYLLNVLRADPKLRTSYLVEELLALNEFMLSPPDERTFQKNAEAIRQLSNFGPVGKALWFLRKNDQPQLRKELGRLATEKGQFIGTQFLFYVAGTFAGHGFDIQFVPESKGQKNKTPDLRATKNGKTIWIEANAKQPVREVNTPERLWQTIRDIVEEKKQKFSDQTYWPGLIVADISPVYEHMSTNSTAPLISVDSHVCTPIPNGGFISRLYDDPDWAARQENQGNVFSFLVEEFAKIDRSRHGVMQCLVVISRRMEADGANFWFPRRHQLIVHRSNETDALIELSRSIYVVE